MSKYTLTMESTYVPSWGIVEAVRELFQNSIDNQTVNPENEMYFNYDAESEKLVIGNKLSILKTSSLLLGSSTKRDDPRTIGVHGEGYKLALLICQREGKDLVIYNYGAKEIWTTRMVNSRKFNAKVLEVNVTKEAFWKKAPSNNLEFHISNISAEEYEAIVQSNLHLQNPDKIVVTAPTKSARWLGDILTGDEYKGKLFVNGLYVQHNKHLRYGYNMSTDFIPLNRDRKAIDSFQASLVTAMLWRYSKDQIDKIKHMIETRAEDIYYLRVSTLTGSMISSTFNWGEDDSAIGIKDYNQLFEESLKSSMTKSFIASNGVDKVPVRDQDGINRLKLAGVTKDTVVVPSAIYDWLEESLTAGGLEEMPTITPKSALISWFEGVKDKLSADEVAHFEYVVSLL